MKKKISSLLIIVFLLMSCKFLPQVNPEYDAVVIAVIDGDTIKIRFLDERPAGCNATETVRLIGVDTPELNYDFYAEEAKVYTNQLYIKQVLICLDQTNTRDKYGRLLSYVYYNNILWNEHLIEEGYGYYYPYFAFDRCKMDDFELAQEIAKDEQKGIWQ